MTSYRAVLKLTPITRFPWDRQVLDSQTVLDSITGVVAHQISTDQWGCVTLDVTLARQDHHSALNDLLSLAQQLGYSLLNGEIRKLVGSEIEAAILGGLGTGALGTASHNTLVVLLAAAGGAVVGWIVGSSLQKIEVVYDLQLDPFGRWTFTPRAPTSDQAQPAVA